MVLASSTLAVLVGWKDGQAGVGVEGTGREGLFRGGSLIWALGADIPLPAFP